jgi:hypothetical protein
MNTLYFIETKSARLGRWFIECDRDSNSRDSAIKMIRSGEVDPVKVLEIDEGAGTCRDVTEEFLHCAKWGDHVEQTPIAAALDHARDLRKHGETV